MQLTLTPKLANGNWEAYFTVTGVQDPALALPRSIPADEAREWLDLYQNAGIPEDEINDAAWLVRGMLATDKPGLKIDKEDKEGSRLVYSQGDVTLVTEPIHPGEIDPTKAMERMGRSHRGIFNCITSEVMAAVRAEGIKQGGDEPIVAPGRLGWKPDTIFARF